MPDLLDIYWTGYDSIQLECENKKAKPHSKTDGEKNNPSQSEKKEVNLIDEQNNQKEESQFRQEKKQKERDGRDKLIVILLQCPTDNHQPERYRCR